MIRIMYNKGRKEGRKEGRKGEEKSKVLKVYILKREQDFLVKKKNCALTRETQLYIFSFHLVHSIFSLYLSKYLSIYLFIYLLI